MKESLHEDTTTCDICVFPIISLADLFCDRSDIKVAQFAMSSAIQGGSNSQVLPCLPWPLIAPKAGYVAEHSAYHHGSLDSNITNHDLNGDKVLSLLWWVATFDLLRSYFLLTLFNVSFDPLSWCLFLKVKPPCALLSRESNLQICEWMEQEWLFKASLFAAKPKSPKSA